MMSLIFQKVGSDCFSAEFVKFGRKVGSYAFESGSDPVSSGGSCSGPAFQTTVFYPVYTSATK